MSYGLNLFTSEIISQIEIHKKKALQHLMLYEFDKFHDHRKIIQGLKIATEIAYKHKIINLYEFNEIANYEKKFQKKVNCLFSNMKLILKEKK